MVQQSNDHFQSDGKVSRIGSRRIGLVKKHKKILYILQALERQLEVGYGMGIVMFPHMNMPGSRYYNNLIEESLKCGKMSHTVVL